MRILTCLTQDHDILLVMLAALMCLAGSYVSAKLFRRTLKDKSDSRFYWCFLAAVTAGAAIWATHFIAMLGYQPNVPVTFAGNLTIVSALIAIAGTAIGLVVAMHRNRFIAAGCGGGTIGLAIAAMHYVGMFAYRVDGVVSWSPGYVIASIAIAILASAMVIDQIRTGTGRHVIARAVGFLTVAIVGLHFTGMAAFAVAPVEGLSSGADSAAFTALAISIALAALLILGAGISTHLLENRAQIDSQARLQHIALHDELTEIVNRRGFSKALGAECTRLQRYGRPFALLMVDLDRFKSINDTFGHPVGDEVLRRVAGRLRSAVRSGDLLARLGGDEFAVIAYGLDTLQDAERLARRIVEVIERPFIVTGHIAEIGASVGVVLAPTEASRPEKLIRKADVALYTAKKEGKGQYCIYRAELGEALERRRLIEADLRRACMRDEFNVVYQPVIDAVSGNVTGAEALLRWSCEGRGEVSPSEFIPIAEELGLVTRMGAGVLKQACRDAVGWPSDISISVNISPIQLLDPKLPQTVLQALEESGLSSDRLELEITETALIGNDEIAMKVLSGIRDLGVRISLDDFGTGYSSLSYLHRFPISRLKIDRSFVRQLPTDQGSASIIRAISQLGKSLNLKITAEGIETQDQLAFVSSHGCDNLQGFLISHPIRSDLFLDLVLSETRKEAV
ncbi:putative bifunctional diguanylate cyclase/phosphodiesterase [Aurantiacibacter poecillastricola]|uniref:putative bifunctional diguanylate cyclase/phosphodiesterase n=1 Tax=Aurantiacibacter poecillastricola TaxID=3064385 RepID=UPI00273E8902|nr:EAL domain-containing protein [Aurantiacibacter sp. 219JJ12-13]MDP5260231.1 EAL domain-containing protein [Aurantiacibacter sp. 219JJ12-13]